MGMRNALMASAYPMTTHCTVGRSVRKWSAMVGSATITLPWSATFVNMPSASAANAHHL